jgi:nitrite reductase/ring-hydroxylating ferredoxin subunit
VQQVWVCKEGEIPDGQVRVLRTGKLEIGVIFKSGEYYAYRNLCPHQGGPVCEGMKMPGVVDLIDDKGLYLGQTFDEDDMHIVCPWHGYEFHLSNGENVCDKRLKLMKFDVLRRDGMVYVAV